ncbi:uncharacterized protein LOC141696779 isoform X1 [Apium graveolens]|uniref:uncharacterized protein LOC141696779 isoform X1 n=1 Tax=Apium graveolens TaxID=4045 RepID=UPI003D79AA36
MDELYALYDAAISGDVDAIADLEMAADELYEDDRTILHIESEKGNAERVRFILREFANKNLLVKLNMLEQTALHLAVRKGHTEVAEVIIGEARRQLPETSLQALLREGDLHNDTALHYAVMEKNVAIVKLLVEADPTDTHAQNDDGKTPMYLAVAYGFDDIVEIIFTTCTAPSLNGPNGTALRMNNLDQAESPGRALYKIMDKDTLFAAAIAGDADVIAHLEMQADRLLTRDDETILHIESRNGNTNWVRFILRNFSNKNLLTKLTRQKYTALHFAIYRGHTEVAEVITEAARRHLPETSFQAFLRQADEDMDTALHAAVMKGSIEILKLLVESDPTHKHEQNSKGKTPIHIAAENGYTDIVKVLCTTCTAPLNLDGPGSSTALHAAIKKDNDIIEVVEALIDAARRHLPKASFQAFLRHGDEDMETPLHYAVTEGNVAIVKLLVEADPTDPHIQNNDGKTPMYIAVEKGLKDIVEIISTTCTSPSLDGPDGSTALHAAIKDGNHDIDVVEMLIDAARRLPSDNDITESNPVSSFQAFIRRVDEDMNSALHIAAMQGNLDKAKLLVEVDRTYPGIQNNEGQTPFFIAVERGHADIVKMMCITCTAPFSLRGPGGWVTALLAVIKNLDEAKNEVRDVINLIVDLFKGWVISENADIEYLEKALLDDLFSVTDEYRQTVGHAVERNYLELVELISDVTNPYYTDFVSLIPLIYKAKDKEYKNMLTVLTEWYEAAVKKCDHERWSTYFYASNHEYMNRVNQDDVISAIRRHQTGASGLDSYAPKLVKFADKLGWTLLHHAAYNESNSIITTIIEDQKRVGHLFEYQDMISTPFHVAAEKGYTYTVILLMQLWPSWSSAYTAVDKKGQNILHLAALQYKKEMIQGILKYCPEEHKKKFVNQQDENGFTPLHLLIKGGCFVAELMRYEGLDIKVQNKEKWTPPELLYIDQEIIDDQVKIKIALNHIQPDHMRDVFSFSVLSVTKREKKNVLFNEQAKQMIYKKHARMKESTHATANCFEDAIAGDPICKAAL